MTAGLGISCRLGLLLVLAALPASPAHALSHMEHYNSLVAGGDEQGFQDGAYFQARFNNPSGLCFDPMATRLFVADRDNNRIRLIHLDGNNQVETLAGTGAPGNDDGPLASASFNHPQCVAFIPPDSLAVFDQGSSHLRIIDLQAGLVSTVPGGPLGGVWNMAYDTTDGGLYYSEPWEQKVLRLDWASRAVATVLNGNSQVPHPKALCFYKDHLYLADQDLPGVYRMDVKAPAPGYSADLVGVGHCAQHYTAGGNALIARLLDYYLLKQAWVP